LLVPSDRNPDPSHPRGPGQACPTIPHLRPEGTEQGARVSALSPYQSVE